MNNKKLATAFMTGLLWIVLLMPLLAEEPAEQPNPEKSPPLDTDTSPLGIMHNQVYLLDNKVQTLQKEIEQIKAQVIEALKNNKLELVKELNDKAAIVDKNLKDTQIELDIAIDNYQREFASRPWWQKLMIELGPQYTFFDNDININDVTGARLRVYYRQETFGRYHTYPFIGASDSPIRDIISSPLIFEYRFSQHDTNGKNNNVQVNTYLAGFGLSGQLFNKSFIHLSIMGGLQDYSGTQPDDIGPAFSYSMGLQQYFSKSFILGIMATEDWVLTKATQIDNKTASCFNFSMSFVGRLKF